MIKESALKSKVQQSNDKYREAVIQVLQTENKQPYQILDSIFQLEVPEVRSYCTHYIADIVDMYQLAPKAVAVADDEARCMEILRLIEECLLATEDDGIFLGGGNIRYYYADKHYRRLYEDGFKLESDLI